MSDTNEHIAPQNSSVAGSGQHISTSNETDANSEDEMLEDSESDPLKIVAPEILAHLSHLDLSGKVTFNSKRLVGGGAFGDVFKGRLRSEDGGTITVCIKRLRFYLSEDIKTLFEKEIYVWSKLKDTNILPLMGYAFDYSNLPLLVSKWMANGSAWEFVNTHPDCDVVHLVKGVAEGLAYLHENNVIHSDIKPDNVLITESGDAVICDFGYSRMLAASKSLGNLSSGIKGTPQYLAYELVVSPNANHSKEADVWAFGITIFELITRQRAFGGAMAHQVIVAISKLELPTFPESSMGSLAPGMKSVLWNACQLCWERDPARRPGMDVILQRLDAPEAPPVETPAFLIDFDSDSDSESESEDEIPVRRTGRRRLNVGKKITRTTPRVMKR